MNSHSTDRAETRRLFANLLIVLLGPAVFSLALAQQNTNWRVPPEATKLKNPIPSNEKTLSAGKAVYAEKCSQCHGDTGDGKTDIAATLSVKPQDLADSHLMSRVTDGEFFWKISEGKRPMPGFKNRLSEEERWQVVNYIRTFSKSSTPGKAATKN